MDLPKRIPAGLVKWADIDKAYNAFFEVCAEPIEFGDEKFATTAIEILHQTLLNFYGQPGLDFLEQTQGKYQ